MLKTHRSDLTFTRTDRNGQVTFEKSGAEVTANKSHGKFNDFTVNRKSTARSAAGDEMYPGTTAPVFYGADAATRSSETVRDVEVTARVPHIATRVTLVIGVEPGGRQVRAAGAPAEKAEKPKPRRDTEVPSSKRPGRDDFRFANGRRLNKNLLFITHSARFASNIGQSEAQRVLAEIRRAGMSVIEIPDNAATAEQAVEPILHELSGRQYDGAVVLGGYDVVPPQRLDVLDPGVRQRLENLPPERQPEDRFIVWSDDLYGDSDGDRLPNIPVSRIPDGHLASVVFAALGADAPRLPQKFGVRNVKRPFAETVYPLVPGAGANLNVSAPFGPNNVTPGMGTGAAYFMLHGSDTAPSRSMASSQIASDTRWRGAWKTCRSRLLEVWSLRGVATPLYLLVRRPKMPMPLCDSKFEVRGHLSPSHTSMQALTPF